MCHCHSLHSLAVYQDMSEQKEEKGEERSLFSLWDEERRRQKGGMR